MVFRNKKALITALIQPTDVVLDVGFWGQGVAVHDANWPHRFLKERAHDVYGVDLTYDTDVVQPRDHYKEASAESFTFPGKTFNKIFAGDLIEHLSNPGLFLTACAKHIDRSGQLIITTPNCFNLFNLAGKLTRPEPVVNRDHTCYFNKRTLARLLEKNGWRVVSVSYIYTLGNLHKESFRKKVLNIVYAFCSLFTDKFTETLVIVAEKIE